MATEHDHAFAVRPGMRRGARSDAPLPLRLVSNEEFAPRLGLGRREFLKTSGGMAVSLLAMNAVFGRFFDVLPVEAADPAAFQERAGEPFFIFDVQVHYVGSGYDPDNAEAGRQGAVTKQGLLGLRKRAQRMNPKR